MKNTLRIVSLVLTAVMLFSLTACAGRNQTWAVEVDGEQIPVGLYLYYQFNAYQQASSLAADADTAVLKQKIEDQDAGLWIHQKTIDYCRKNIATEREFERLEMTLSETDLSYIDSMVTYILSYYGEVFEKNGIGEESVRKACTTDQKTSALFYKYYGTDGLEAVSETELMSYYTENYAVAYMLGTTLTPMEDEDEQKARDEKARAAANNAVESIQAGKGIAETAAQMSKELDETTQTDETLDDSAYLSVVKKDDTGYPEALREQVFKAAVDAPLIYDQDSHLLVYVRKDAASQTDVFESLKNTILQTLKGDEFSAKLAEMANALAVNENASAVSYYSASKIKDFE